MHRLRGVEIEQDPQPAAHMTGGLQLFMIEYKAQCKAAFRRCRVVRSVSPQLEPQRVSPTRLDALDCVTVFVTPGSIEQSWHEDVRKMS